MHLCCESMFIVVKKVRYFFYVTSPIQLYRVVIKIWGLWIALHLLVYSQMLWDLLFLGQSSHIIKRAVLQLKCVRSVFLSFSTWGLRLLCTSLSLHLCWKLIYLFHMLGMDSYIYMKTKAKFLVRLQFPIPIGILKLHKTRVDQ